MALPTMVSCDGDLFNDTSWTYNVCPVDEGPQAAACVLDAAPGVFVRTEGSDSASGTRDAPVRTVQRAIDLASASGGAGRVYVCAETFAEAITVPSGVRIFGGLACADGWKWQTQVFTEIAPSEGVPITLLPGDGTTVVEDLHALAAAATDPGASSIAVIAAGTTATIVRGFLRAGVGMDGAAGATGQPARSSVLEGKSGGNACTAGAGRDGTAGGTPVTQQCGDEASVSGAGGASPPNGASGGPGSPGQPDAPAGGEGGEGQPGGTSSWECATVGKGADGAPGAPGATGAGASVLGTATASGFTPAAGAAGAFGKPGQGGGGGGASSGNGCAGGAPGAGGGSGGPGGCGGAPGGGGGGGGASIALLSVDARVSVRTSRLQAASGGRGGDGAIGGEGGDGGAGGPGGDAVDVDAGCPGGKGGKGGNGGNGGGGRGGHSASIAFVGTAVALDNVSELTHAPKVLAASGGAGGGGSPANAGAGGVNGEVLDLTPPAAD